MPLQLRQSARAQLLDPETFLWCTGIEDTFITAPHPRTGRSLDEYELTGHYERWHGDLGLIAELGLRSARYGIPWHRINPARHRWEWDWVDRAVDRMLELGVEPIIDLVHYGLPSWIDGAYLNPDFAEHMAEYAGKVAQRYRGRVHAYTPLNEPRITAWYCGRIGWWPPFQRSWKGFVAVMTGVCKGIVRTVETLHQVDPEILPVHVDATDLYDTSDEGLREECEQRQEIVFLALDLVSGRIQESHRLTSWLRRQGMSDETLDWFSSHAIELPFIGINLYPMFTQKILARDARGRFRIKMPYADGQLIDRLGEMYWKRYRAPVFVSETASVGSVARREAWLKESLAAVRRLRVRGIPLVGYTWWPLFALVTWGYRQGTKEPPFYLKQMGLWDLTDEMERVKTRLVEEYRNYVAGGCQAVELLANISGAQPARKVPEASRRST
jgi:beta-glucosidase